MFSVSDLKDKAAKAKDYSMNKITTTREHMKSQPSKNFNWNAEPKAAPPRPPPSRPKNSFAPPPSRTSGQPRSPSSVSASSPSSLSANSPSSPSPPSLARRPPPIVRRDSRPDNASPPPPPSRSVSARLHASPVEAETDRIDWANLTEEDKQVLFSWLDEFFARYLNIDVVPITERGSVKVIEQPARSIPLHLLLGPCLAWLHPRSLNGPDLDSPPSPMVRISIDSMSCTFSRVLASFTTSYPSPTIRGSAALDLAHYFAPSTYWDAPWYASENPLPAPPLVGNTEVRLAGAMRLHGSTKMVYGGALFADLSMCWFVVEFPTNTHADPNDARVVRRSVQYLPRPVPMDRAALLEAHETYGETVAAFAESFEGTGEYCARECWDLAAQALEYFEQYDYVPKPVPSIWRTHGHMIFEGKATGKGRPQYGRWRGGDDRVRRGDIVEWRSVKIGMTAGTHVYTQILGDPDHTAVIVSDVVPTASVADGRSVRPAEIGTLEVVEQSVGSGKTPHRSTYVLSGLEEGEMWIYRPVSMLAYVGCFLEAECPAEVNAHGI